MLEDSEELGLELVELDGLADELSLDDGDWLEDSEELGLVLALGLADEDSELLGESDADADPVVKGYANPSPELYKSLTSVLDNVLDQIPISSIFPSKYSPPILDPILKG